MMECVEADVVCVLYDQLSFLSPLFIYALTFCSRPTALNGEEAPHAPQTGYMLLGITVWPEQTVGLTVCKTLWVFFLCVL